MTPSYQGIIPPMITPLKKRETLEVKGLGRLVNRIINGGVPGIFALGTSGEAPSLSGKLRREVIEHTCNFVDGRVPGLVGITDTSLVESALLAQDTAKFGASAVVTSAPFYFPAGQAALREYLEQLLRLALEPESQSRCPLQRHPIQFGRSPLNFHHRNICRKW